MNIKVLGTRGEIEEKSRQHSKKSGVLINDTILLDCGEKTFLNYNPEYILITHLHPDHAYFVRHNEIPLTNAKIYAPEKYNNLKISITNKPFTIESYKITPIPTEHSIKVKSNAYLIEYKNKKMLYTGDMIWIKKKYHHLLHDLDLVITEGSFAKKGGMVRRNKNTGSTWPKLRRTGEIYGHTGIPNLVNLFKKYTNKILFVHFGAWFFKDIKESKKFFNRLTNENEIEIIVGYDSLELEI